MINFERFVLSNGLRLLVHTDKSTPMAVVMCFMMWVPKMKIPIKPGLHIYLST